MRELDYKLVLATMLARPGNQIFLGNHTDVYELGKRLQNGLYLGKNVLNVSPTRMTECYDDLKLCGFRVIHLDEEGAFFQGDEERWKERLSARLNPNWMKPEDILCTWGEFQARHYREQIKEAGPAIKVTGHPRFNMAHPQFAELYREEIDDLQQRYGRFILVNTNFKYGNHLHGADYYFDLYSIAPDQEEERNYYLNFWAHTQRRLVAFIELVNAISNRFPDYQIVLRPHQAEGEECYRRWFSHIPRAHVTHDGRLQAWLHAAEALVHDGCTTGIEAWIGQKKVIIFHPEDDPRFNYEIPNQLGVYCRDPEEVLSAMAEPQSSGSGNNVDAVRDLLANLDEPGEVAFERLRDLAWQVEDELEPTRLVGNVGSFVRRGSTEKLKRALRRFFRPVIGPYRPHDPFVHQRFPGLEPERIRFLLGKLKERNPRSLHTRFFSSKLMSLWVDP